MPKRVVFVGAGHAQLYGLKRTGEFIRRGFEAVAIAPDAFWYSGLATGMLGGIYPPELDRIDVAALVEAGGGRFVQDSVVGLDAGARILRLAHSPPIRYDALSLTLGSEPPSIPGARDRKDTYAAKPVRRLWELRFDLEERFRSRPSDVVRLVIAGGGVTACEIAANIARLAAANEASVQITVMAGGRGFLEQLPRSAARKVVRALESRGVVFRRDNRVERLEDGWAVVTGAPPVPFDILVNATGLKAAPLLRELGLPVVQSGALLVNEHLRCVSHPAIHGGGDGIAFCGRDLPKIGVYAIRQAPILFHNLLAALEGKPPARFRPQRRFLWIMNLGDATGIAVRGSLYWHGRAAFRLKDWIDRHFLRDAGSPAARAAEG